MNICRESHKFLVRIVIAINCIPIPDEYPNNNRVSNTVHKIAYIGNLSHNRWKTLSFLADILSNSEFKNRFVLEIYTREAQ